MSGTTPYPDRIVHGQCHPAAGSVLGNFAEFRTPPPTAITAKGLPPIGKRFNRRLNFSHDWKRLGGQPEGQRTRILRRDARNGLVNDVISDASVSGDTATHPRPRPVSLTSMASVPQAVSGPTIGVSLPSPLSPTRQMSTMVKKRTARRLFGRRDSGCVESPDGHSRSNSSPFDHLAGGGDTALTPSSHGPHHLRRRRPSGDLYSQAGGKRSRSTALSATSMASISDASPVSELLRSPESAVFLAEADERGSPDEISRPGSPGQRRNQPGHLALPGALAPLPPIAAVFTPVEAAALAVATSNTGSLRLSDSTAGVATSPARQDEFAARLCRSSPPMMLHAVSEPVNIPGKPRGRSTSLRERRQGKRPSMSFSLPTNVVVNEDTRDDTATEEQRDMLFSKATEMVRAARRNTIGAIPVSQRDSDSKCAHPAPSPSGSLDDWAAAELQQYMEAFAV